MEYIENVVSPAEAAMLFEAFQELPFQRQVDSFGPLDRKIFYCGDKRCVFTFNGLRLEPQRWTPLLIAARVAVGRACGIDPALLTACLVNEYPADDGSIPFHQDEVKAHGEQKIVAALSLGGPRPFCLRNLKDGSEREFDLQPGSVLLMTDHTSYEHALPLRPHAPPRISCTFRSIVPGAED